mmetsp:Transcript_54676/g.122990  ORF Transcript_54676/g.122990 Transcript_54676/m.122990 type:complete len:358 (-) Transcript_54676:306-1379(-)
MRRRLHAGRPVVQALGALADDEVESAVVLFLQACSLLARHRIPDGGRNSVANEEGAVCGLEGEPGQVGGVALLVKRPEEAHQPRLCACVLATDLLVVLLVPLRLEEPHSPVAGTTTFLDALLPLCLAPVPLRHGKQLQGEGALSDHVHEGEANGVQLRVLDDAQALEGEGPPHGERQPADDDDHEELQVTVWEACLHTALNHVEHTEVGNLDDREPDLDCARRGKEPELARRLEIVQVPRLHVRRDAARVHFALNHRGSIAQQQHEGRDEVGEDAVEAEAWHHGCNQKDQLRLHGGAGHGVAEVTEPVDVVDVQPALNGQNPDEDLERADGLIDLTAHREAPLQRKLVHLGPMRDLL